MGIMKIHFGHNVGKYDPLVLNPETGIWGDSIKTEAPHFTNILFISMHFLGFVGGSKISRSFFIFTSPYGHQNLGDYNC